MYKKGLGRGLSSLLSEEILPNSDNTLISELNVSKLVASVYQPRERFDPIKLEELATSIKNHGIIQPLIVVKEEDQYKIIAGERRWRAAQLIGLKKVPVIIQDIQPKQALKLALIENIQRDDLTSIEEAKAYARLISSYSYTQEEIANIVGKSRSHVANLLRLNSLDDEIKTLVNDGILSMGHARCLVNIPDYHELLQNIINNHLSVRQTEELIKKRSKLKLKNKSNAKFHKDNFVSTSEISSPNYKEDLKMVAEVLIRRYGVKVTINSQGSDKNVKGEIILHFENAKDLEQILLKVE